MGEGLIGPKTVHEDLLFRDHCFGVLSSFFQIFDRRGELAYNLDLGMVLCKIPKSRL